MSIGIIIDILFVFLGVDMVCIVGFEGCLGEWVDLLIFDLLVGCYIDMLIVIVLFVLGLWCDVCLFIFEFVDVFYD